MYKDRIFYLNIRRIIRLIAHNYIFEAKLRSYFLHLFFKESYIPYYYMSYCYYIKGMHKNALYWMQKLTSECGTYNKNKIARLLSKIERSILTTI